jgi:hypothetical protein
MMQVNNIQNRDYENIKKKYRELYSDQIDKQSIEYHGKKPKPSINYQRKNPKLTNHAKRRLWERFHTQ